jgi:hypothetical protein
MPAKLPLKNDLQKEFATRANKEKNTYILPWTRGFFTAPSSLDPIYEDLGAPKFNDANYYTSLRNKIQNLPIKKRQKYPQTLRWLRTEVLDGDYVQQGNSCGAWSLTHLQMRKNKRYYGALEFRTNAQANYDLVKFESTDGSVLPKPAFLNIWTTPQPTPAVNPAYANPWKIVDKMPGSELKILKAARTFASNRGNNLEKCFDDMLKAIDALGPAAPPQIKEGDLSTLPTGSCAIIILYADNLISLPTPLFPAGSHAVPLHYMLVAHTTAGWEVFNSNSHKLNTTNPILASCPTFQDTITHSLRGQNGTDGGPDSFTWQFLGLFIS